MTFVNFRQIYGSLRPDYTLNWPCKNLSTAILQTQYVRFVSKLSIKLNLPFSLQQAYFHAKFIIHVPFNLKQSDSHSMFCTVNCFWLCLFPTNIRPDSVAKRFQNRSISLEYTKRPNNPLSFWGLLPLEPTPIYSPLASLATLWLFLIGRAPPSTPPKSSASPAKIFQQQFLKRSMSDCLKVDIKLNLPFSLQQTYFHAKVVIHIPFLKQSDSHSIFYPVNCYDSDSSLASTTCHSPSVQKKKKKKKRYSKV